MRSRKKPYTQQELETSKYIIKNPEDHRGSWHKYFNNTNPIHIEIGCGKGSFVTTLAAKEAGTNFIALEREKEIIVIGTRRLKEMANPPTNLGFILEDAVGLTQIFARGEVARIYLNFSDPWPNRAKWAKRRLTYKTFLLLYKEILAPGGQLHFKTDSQEFYEFTHKELTENNWEVIDATRDLHSTPFHLSGANIMTEYEMRFTAQNKPIYRIEGIVKA